MNAELGKLKEEQQRVRSQRADYERLMKKCQSDIADFEAKKGSELAAIGEMRDKESKRVAQERRLLERQNKASSTVVSVGKKEKDEIEQLKKENEKLREETKGKDSKFRQMIDRMKKQLEDVCTKNSGMEKEMRELKEKLLSVAQAKSVRSQKKDKENAMPVNEPTAAAKKPLEKLKPDLIAPIMESPNERDSDCNENGEIVQEAKTKAAICSNRDKAMKRRKNDVEEYDIQFLPKYHAKCVKIVSQRTFNDGKVSKQYENGKTEIIFTNGVRKESFQDGYSAVYFVNKDVKQVPSTLACGRRIRAARWCTTSTRRKRRRPPSPTECRCSSSRPDRSRSTTQTGPRRSGIPCGETKGSFPDGTLKCVFADGGEESIFTDGTVQRAEKDGAHAVEYPSGEKEIAFPDGSVIHEFPDGRVRKTYPDGTF